MNKTDLQALLTARYHQENWKNIQLGVFHDRGAKISFEKNPWKCPPVYSGGSSGPQGTT